MALQAVANDRGSALIEAVATFAVLLALVSGLLGASYLLAARSWLDFQSEQALYCLAERRPGCGRELQRRVRLALPWGVVRVRRLHTEARDRFSVDVEWTWRSHGLRLRKSLNIKQIVRSKASRWPV